MRMLFRQYKEFRTLFWTLKRLPYGWPWSLEDFATNIRNSLSLTKSLSDSVRIQAFIEFYLEAIQLNSYIIPYRVRANNSDKRLVKKQDLVRCFRTIQKELELGLI